MSSSRNSWTFALVAALLFAGVASAAPKAKVKKPQQVVPTGAEDSPQAPAPNIAAELALEQMTSRSDEGLTIVVNADGSESVDLQGRFHSVLLMTTAAEGDHANACLSGHEAKQHLTVDRSTTAPANFGTYQRLERSSAKPLTAPPVVLPAPKAPVALEVM